MSRSNIHKRVWVFTRSKYRYLGSTESLGRNIFLCHFHCIISVAVYIAVFILTQHLNSIQLVNTDINRQYFKKNYQKVFSVMPRHQYHTSFHTSSFSLSNHIDLNYTMPTDPKDSFICSRGKSRVQGESLGMI